jgi:hypothetical protein
MKNHTIYFELYGKKMKATILAESKADAMQKIRDKIVFHKVEVDKSDDQYSDKFDNIADFLINGLKYRK